MIWIAAFIYLFIRVSYYQDLSSPKRQKKNPPPFSPEVLKRKRLFSGLALLVMILFGSWGFVAFHDTGQVAQTGPPPLSRFLGQLVGIAGLVTAAILDWKAVSYKGPVQKGE
jgi:hypothetical protein